MENSEIYKNEKDAIALLGLMALASKGFDHQVVRPDGDVTHTFGLNIFAAIIDNIDGEVIGQGRNAIHSSCNPLLHAEQDTLRLAIDRLYTKRSDYRTKYSVEKYYREFLFNSPDSVGNFDVGGTIYTTLEPCPYCTSALLVSRMKRIVYILPDVTFGNSFSILKPKFYPGYDMTYDRLCFDKAGIAASGLIRYANSLLQALLGFTLARPKLYGTLVLDSFEEELNSCRWEFLGYTRKDLITTAEAIENNYRTLTDLQRMAS